MSAVKHTPGPWRLHRQAEYVVDAEGDMIASFNSRGGEGEHNARLASAAPSLADALEALLGLLNGGFINIECTKQVSAQLIAAEEAATAALLAAGRLP